MTSPPRLLMAATALFLFAGILIWSKINSASPVDDSDKQSSDLPFRERAQEESPSRVGERTILESRRSVTPSTEKQKVALLDREDSQAQAKKFVRESEGSEAINQAWQKAVFNARGEDIEKSERFLTQVSSAWTKKDPEATWKWIERHGVNGPDFNSAIPPRFLGSVIGGYIEAIVLTDPEGAAEASEALPGGENDLTQSAENQFDPQVFQPHPQNRPPSEDFLPLRSYRLPGRSTEAPGPTQE